MATPANYQWKDLWRGPGPAWSPSGAPPGLTIVHSKAAWIRLITAFGPPYEEHKDLPVDWDKNLILFVQANEDHVDTEVHLKSLSRAKGAVAIAAELRRPSGATPTFGVEVRPWIIASAPSAAFAENPKVRFTIDGRELPVSHVR